MRLGFVGAIRPQDRVFQKGFTPWFTDRLEKEGELVELILLKSPKRK